MLTKGLIQIYTGDSKGKTTAAVGLAVRAAGAGLRVAFVQFVKGGKPSSELQMLRQLGVEVVRPAERSSGVLRNDITEDDRQAVRAAWEFAACAMDSGQWDVVVLDELNIAVKYGMADLDAVLQALATRPQHVEVIITGRNAHPALVAVADLVTEMTLVKHPFTQGVPARLGIEY